jgi:hypothetical protein
VVEEALEEWLTRQEDAEDIAVSEVALEAIARGEGVDADEFFRRMVAEGPVDYQTDPER